MAKYRLTRKAVEDFADSWSYMFDKWMERQAGDYYNKLIAFCQKIATNPELFDKRYDESKVQVYTAASSKKEMILRC